MNSGALCEQILSIKQVDSITEYRRLFVTMAAPLDLQEGVLLSKWYDGMKEDFREEV
jgi:hypothetical protein